MTKSAIPAFDLYKKLSSHLSFELDRLEQSYHEYDSSHPHRHNYYEILFFHNNGGTHEIDFRQFNVTSRTIHFVSPEQVHLLRRKKEVTGYVISFTSDLFLSTNSSPDFIDQFPFFNLNCLQPVIEFSKENVLHVTHLIQQIEKEFLSTDSEKKQMISLLLAQLLIFCKRNFNEQLNDAGDNRLTNRFRKLVNQHFKNQKSVKEYASLLKITSGHLNDTIQREIGRTASEIIFERILLEAKRLLYHSTLSVKEIAADLNYEDPSYFTRFFKTHTQMTPEQFRKTIREKYH